MPPHLFVVHIALISILHTPPQRYADGKREHVRQHHDLATEKKRYKYPGKSCLQQNGQPFPLRWQLTHWEITTLNNRAVTPPQIGGGQVAPLKTYPNQGLKSLETVCSCQFPSRQIHQHGHRNLLGNTLLRRGWMQEEMEEDKGHPWNTHLPMSGKQLLTHPLTSTPMW